jgi:leucyl aminopeptidase
MTDAVKVGFVSFSGAPSAILAVFCDDALGFGPSTRKALGAAAGLIKRAAETNRFKGKNGSVLDILAPQGLKARRLIVVGVGKPSELKDQDFLKLGGTIAGKLKPGREAVGVLAELPKGAMTADQAAAIASGIRLRAYAFDR